MNIYFWDPSHIKHESFSLIFETLQVKTVYLLSETVDSKIKKVCENLIGFQYDAGIYLHTEEGKSFANKAIYHFVDTLRQNGNLLDLYKESTPNALLNLRNVKINDPNILVILPPVNYIDDKDLYYTPVTVFPQHFAQYSLNILRKIEDDRYSERLAFLFIDSYLGKAIMYKRKNVMNRFGVSKSPVISFFFKKKYAFTSFIVRTIIKNHPEFKDSSNNLKIYIEKLLKEEDFQKYDEHKQLLMERRNEIYEQQCEDAAARTEAEEWRRELDHMYQDAYDGNPEYEWNND